MPGVSRIKLAEAGVAVTPGVMKPNEPAHEKLVSLGAYKRNSHSVNPLHGHLDGADQIHAFTPSESVEEHESVLTGDMVLQSRLHVFYYVLSRLEAGEVCYTFRIGCPGEQRVHFSFSR